MNVVHVTPTRPRQASEVVRDFAACAERLARMAGDWREGQFRTTDLSDADAATEGLRALLRELRQQEVGHGE